MNRLIYLKLIVAIVVIALLLPACSPTSQSPTLTISPNPPTANGPNVLFIIADDMLAWTGYLGNNPDVQTPNIDRLAARGLYFTNAHVQGAACNPSRTSFLTGLQPYHTGVYSNAEVRFRDLLPAAVTIPQYFQQHGYQTIGVGKVTHNQPERESWDILKEVLQVSLTPPYYPMHGYTELTDITPEIDWGAVEPEQGAIPDVVVADFAIEQLQHTHAAPWFMAVGFHMPHVPIYVPEQYRAPFFDDPHNPSVTLLPNDPSDADDLPRLGKVLARTPHLDVLRQYDALDELTASYHSGVALLDAQVGRLLDALDASGYADNTIIVFTSDHGQHLGDKNRIQKNTLWSNVTNVPLIIATPGQTTAGQRSAATVGLVDLYPTLAELAGLPQPQGLDGQSLAPLLVAPGQPWQSNSALTFMLTPLPATRLEQPDATRVVHAAIQDGPYHFIMYAVGDGVQEELYDSFADPNNLTNLAVDPAYDALRAELRERILQQVPEWPIFLNYSAPSAPAGGAAD